MRPLDRRRAALLSTLDEDTGSDWPASQLARLEDDARRYEAQRDWRLREEGRALLDAYAKPGETAADALRRLVRDLLGGKS